MSVASGTMRMLQTLETSGTVREARGIGFQHINLSVFNCVLHVHQAFDMHLFCDLACVFFDRLHIFFGNVHGRDDTGGVSGVDAGQLNVLHNRRYKCMVAVADGVSLTFQWRDAGNGRSGSDGPALRPQPLSYILSGFRRHTPLPCRGRPAHKKDEP